MTNMTNKQKIEGIISLMLADVDALKVLSTEVGQEMKPNGVLYSKCHTIGRIAELQELQLMEIDEMVSELSD